MLQRDIHHRAAYMENTGKRAGKPTEVLLEYKTDLYAKEVKTTQRRLSEKISLFDILLKTNDAERVKPELETLGNLFGIHETAVYKQCNILKDEETKKRALDMLEEERDGFNKVSTAVKDWLKASSNKKEEKHCKIEEKTVVPDVREESAKDHTDKNSPIMQLTYELMRCQVRLEEQLSLFSEIAKAKDSKLMERELTNLTDIRGQMEEISSKLEDHLSVDEKGKVSEIAKRADAQAKEISARIARKTANVIDDEGRSQKSTTSKRSRKSTKSLLQNVMVRDHSRKRSLSTGDFLSQSKPSHELHPVDVAARPPHNSATSERSHKSGKSGSSKGRGTSEATIAFNESKAVAAIQRLKNQDELVREILETSNTALMKKEMSLLNDLYDEARDLVELVRRQSGNRRALDEYDQAKIEKTKSIVVNWMIEQLAKERESKASSNSSRHSKRSKGSSGKRSTGYNENERYAEGERKEWRHFEGQLLRLRNQRLLVESFLSTLDADMMNRELDMLERMHQNLAIATKELSNGPLSGKAVEAEKELREEEKQSFLLKKKVVKWFVSLEEAETSSHSSRTSRQSSISTGSVRSKERDEKLKTEEEQREELKKEISELLTIVQAKKNNCDQYAQVKNGKALNKEVARLEETYDQAVNVAFKLREVLETGEAEEIMQRVKKEDVEILQLKQKAVTMMTEGNAQIENVNEKVKANDQELVSHSKSSFTLWRKEESLSEDHLKKEVNRLGKRLENQKCLVNGLLKSNDTEIMNREVQTLDRVYDELIAHAVSLRQVLPPGEARKVSDMIDMEDAHVFQLKKTVSRWFIAQVDTVREQTIGGSKHLQTCVESKQGEEILKAESEAVRTTEEQGHLSQNEELVALKAEVEALKRNGPAPFKGKQAQNEKESSPQPISKEEGKNESEERCPTRSQAATDATDPTTSSLVKLSELMVQTLKLQAAPKVEIDKFSGDPLEYSYFIENFKDAVENLIEDPKQRLMRLLKYTEKGAKELIKHCVHEDAASCYNSALKLLEKEYGSPFGIATAYLEKLKAWPPVKSNDAAGLRELYRFLLRCDSYQRKGIVMDMNSPLTIRTIQLALPTNLQDKWASRAGRIRRKKAMEAAFADFLEFVEEESQTLNDPVYARNAPKESKSGDGRFKTLATEVIQKQVRFEEEEKCTEKTGAKEEEKQGDQKISCPLCKRNHDLDDCDDFTKKTPREKKSYLFRSKMCFSCYGMGHTAKDCGNKRSCGTCGKEHPTGLHEVSFKVSTVSGDDENGTMCIVPVRLCHKGSSEEIDVYAMLDECSTGTFVEERLVEKLGAKRKTTINLGTIIGVRRVETYAVEGLSIKGSEEFEAKFASGEVKLPTTYTQEKIPMDVADIPTPKKIERWDYLKEIMNEIPELKDIPLGLLIGRNCPKALEPIRVINSQGTGPYAKRTRFGWCVIGPDERKNSLLGTKCHSIKVSKPSGPASHIVLNTKISDNAIAEALQEMYRADFVESKAEKRAESKEDEEFLNLMKENVKLVQGHYELPLPLRVDEAPAKEADLEVLVETGSRKKEGPKDPLGSVTMPENRRQAIQRIEYVRRRMKRDPKYKEEYVSSMKKLFAAGHARKVPAEGQNKIGWYLFHHGVRHPTKKKFRVVMDCSAEKEGISLNRKLLQGPDFSNSLIGVLLRFRKGRIPFMADIEAMYYQVRVPEEHRKFLRFLWFEDDDPEKDLMDCEMCVHPFGAISSKNCVNFALHQTAYDNREALGEEAMITLLNEFYVDDLLKSVDSEEAAIRLIRSVIRMCASGGFNLTKFVCSNQEVMNTIPTEKRAEGLKTQQIRCLASPESALGVLWQVYEDSLGFRVNFHPDNGTRRGWLSTISKFHDPLGIGAPFLLKGRKILQKTTASSISWDESVTGDAAKDWAEWRLDVTRLNDLKFPRCYKPRGFGRICSASLHCFADASFIGYGVAIYLRLVDDKGAVEVSLVTGKSRVSPLKPTTVPRLELVAAVLLVKMAALLVEELKIAGIEVFYWTDNKIVLGYIQNRRRRYRVFVANRVRVIEEYTNGDNWGYVPTKENPADYASRGISFSDAAKVERWLKGPEFLRSQDEGWRTQTTEGDVAEDDIEVKLEQKVYMATVEDKSILEHFERRISSWQKMKRVLAWVYRFASHCRKKTYAMDRDGAVECAVRVSEGQAKKVFMIKELSVQELSSAQTSMLKQIQERYLKDEVEQLSKEKPTDEDGLSSSGTPKKKRENEKLRKSRSRKVGGRFWRLNPFIDTDGLMRVGGRLGALEEDKTFKFPVIIPKGTVVSGRLVEFHHSKIEHRGKHSTISELRDQGFWMINGSKEVGKVVFRCVRCKWLRGKCNEQMMANLPASRIIAEPPFSYCGADLFGPLLVKEGRKTLKRYGVLFTCLSLRAIHIEIASSLETDSLIQALRRFIARRGAVREIRSDNGTNFVGADNEFKKLIADIDDEKISSFLSERNCDWVRWERNTPTASHMGGAWERQIRTVREILTSMIKTNPRTLDEETLRTFLTEAEGIVNSRPLTIENLHDPDSEPLSPNNLLTMKSHFVLPPPGVFQKEDMYCRKRWRMAQHLASCFWDRWRKEYLQLLQPRKKWEGKERNLQVDDVVLLKEDGVIRGHWPMGRITEVYPSEDGLVRSVSVQAGGSVLRRPINKTVLLVPAGGGTE